MSLQAQLIQQAIDKALEVLPNSKKIIVDSYHKDKDLNRYLMNRLEWIITNLHQHSELENLYNEDSSSEEKEKMDKTMTRWLDNITESFYIEQGMLFNAKMSEL